MKKKTKTKNKNKKQNKKTTTKKQQKTEKKRKNNDKENTLDDGLACYQTYFFSYQLSLCFNVRACTGNIFLYISGVKMSYENFHINSFENDLLIFVVYHKSLSV